MPNRQATVSSEQSAARSRRSLLARLVLRFSIVLAAALVVLFLTAGTWNNWQAWAYLFVLFVPLLSGYCYFLKTDPQFLATRLDNREQVGEQKQLIRWSGPLFVAAFLLPGLDHRFGWSHRLHLTVPLWLSLLSLALSLAGMLLVLWVMNVNRYAAHTIQVVAGQSVISCGPYRFVRHPLYSGAALLWVFTPLALGSFASLPVFVLLDFFYVIRLLNEEKILLKDLPGYADYCARTRFHLIPFIW
jgi:protein-S-isoprenylcysteine O-methyltransferase Ste14